MTVAELAQLLERMPPEATVYSDGCDCVGAAGAVWYDASDNTVTLVREENMDQYFAKSGGLH